MKSTHVTIGQSYQVILSHRCAYSCGYCEFPHTPSPQLPSRTQILRHARIGLRQGANQIILTSGSHIDSHSEIIAGVLFLGYNSWADYLRSLCNALLDDVDGLMPHDGAVFPVLDCGALSVSDMRRLRSVCPVMRHMLHSIDDDLQHRPAHMYAMHKQSFRSLKELESIGRVGIACTTGIRVGIGERPESWVEAAQAVSAVHRQYGHVALFSLVPFVPTPFTAMSDCLPTSDEMLLEATEKVRNSLDPSIRLSVDLADRLHLVDQMLDLGVQDLGEFRYGNTSMLNMECADVIHKLKIKLDKKGIILSSRRDALLHFIKHRTLPENLRGTEVEEEVANLLERIYQGK